MIGRRLVCLGMGASLCGCGGAVRPVTPPSAGEVAQARAETDAAPPTGRHQLFTGETTRTLRRIATRLEAPADALCLEIGRGSCDWHVEASRRRDVNAHAELGGRVVINRGVLEVARGDEEVAFVMGHEIGHQIARHVAQGQENAGVGAGIASALMSALIVASVAAGGRASATNTNRSMRDARRLGGSVGNLVYSRDQEREADRLGAILLYRAGYDLAAARGFLLTMARLSERRETGWFDSHPAGPERLAAFDRISTELRASEGRVPVRPDQPAA